MNTDRRSHRLAAWLAALPLLVLFALPLTVSLALMLPSLADATGLKALLHHPQLGGATRLTLWTGLASTMLSLVLALAIVAGVSGNPAPRAGAFLALPHLAFTIGAALFIMPPGLLARIIAALFTGRDAPPQWVTTQDPYGLSLIGVLVLKETPFLVWVLASLLNRDDLRAAFQGQRAVARSLGHGTASVFLRVIAPQLLSRARWPLAAVLAYGMTVVDMALVIGPTQPPTLAQLVWADLNDADHAINARGAAGAVLLTVLLVAVGMLAAAAPRMLGGGLSRFLSSAPQPRAWPTRVSESLWALWGAVYALVLLLLLVQSISGVWPFPALLPQGLTLRHWQGLLADSTPLAVSLVMALTTSATALAASVAWFEGLSQTWDRPLLGLAMAMLCLPALLTGLGLYRLLLLSGQSGTGLGLFAAHLLPVAAYVFVLLQGPYRGYDRQWQATAAGLGRSHMAFLLKIKWPMLKAPLLSAFAVGFAVSMAQYVPAQLAAAGRYSTLPIEAVTLASGGNRSLVAAYGLALALLPLLVFITAGILSRPRWKVQ